MFGYSGEKAEGLNVQKNKHCHDGCSLQPCRFLGDVKKQSEYEAEEKELRSDVRQLILYRILN